MDKYHPVTKEELERIVDQSKFSREIVEEVLSRPDRLALLEAKMKKDLKNNERFESESYDMAMRQGDRRTYLNLIKRLRENPGAVRDELVKMGVWKE